MNTYKVHWCDINNTCGGCVEVIAKNEHDAVCQARSIIKLGCNFYLVGVDVIK